MNEQCQLEIQINEILDRFAANTAIPPFALNALRSELLVAVKDDHEARVVKERARQIMADKREKAVYNLLESIKIANKGVKDMENEFAAKDRIAEQKMAERNAVFEERKNRIANMTMAMKSAASNEHE